MEACFTRRCIVKINQFVILSTRSRTLAGVWVGALSVTRKWLFMLFMSNTSITFDTYVKWWSVLTSYSTVHGSYCLPIYLSLLWGCSCLGFPQYIFDSCLWYGTQYGNGNAYRCRDNAFCWWTFSRATVISLCVLIKPCFFDEDTDLQKSKSSLASHSSTSSFRQIHDSVKISCWG